MKMAWGVAQLLLPWGAAQAGRVSASPRQREWATWRSVNMAVLLAEVSEWTRILWWLMERNGAGQASHGRRLVRVGRTGTRVESAGRRSRLPLGRTPHLFVARPMVLHSLARMGAIAGARFAAASWIPGPRRRWSWSSPALGFGSDHVTSPVGSEQGVDLRCRDRDGRAVQQRSARVPRRRPIRVPAASQASLRSR